MTVKPFAPAPERNREAILAALQHELATARTVLEIGSGTGQHAVAFGRALPQLVWQTSDRIDNHPGISAWLEEAGLANVRAPLALDVLTADLPASAYDAVFSANTAHIMNPAAVACMFELVAHTLTPGGVFCLYGPFRENGQFNADSNRDFHESLLSQDPEMGIRDIEQLDELAAAGGGQRRRRYAMPANNLLLVWQFAGSGAADDSA